MKVLLLLCPTALAILLAGCGSAPDLIVTDRAGVPVAGALVEPVAMSINYSPSKTDKDGEVDLPQRAQEVKWLNVSAPGFKTQRVDYTGGSPQRVILDR